MNHQPYHPSFWVTLRKALLLDTDLYANGLNARSNRRDAILIVLLASLSHMIGIAVILLFNRTPFPIFVIALVLDLVSIFMGYLLCTFLVSWIGRRLKSDTPGFQDLLSPIGFAYAPQSLNFLTLIPLMGRGFELILSIWTLLAVVVAIQQGAGFRKGSAALIGLVGWLPIQFSSSVIVLFFSSSKFTSMSLLTM